MHRALALGSAVVLSGCFTYQAVEPPGPMLGDRVRVELTGQGQDNLRARRALALPEVSGQVLTRDEEQLLLRVRLDPRRLGYGTETVVDTVRIPRSDIRRVQVRTLSKDRSIVAGAATLAGVAGAYALFQATQSGGGGPRDRTDPNFLVVPLSFILGMLDGSP